jgi:SAM-dependent methyltransferase
MRSTDWDRIAPEYFKQIESPFSKGVKNPIFSLVRRVGNLERKSVLELGCGTGTLIPFLAKNFRKVVAVDISKKMIEIAKRDNPDHENVEFKVMDMLNITRLRRKFDVIVSVNSLLMPNIPKINSVLKKVHKLLKKKGVFVAIMPGMDSLIYQAMITYDKEFEKRHNRKKARMVTSRIISKRHHDFCYGFFNVGGLQKHFYGFELDYRLKKAGFRNFRIGKVHYPWEMMECDPNPKRFVGGIYEEIWDWTIYAVK